MNLLDVPHAYDRTRLDPNDEQLYVLKENLRSMAFYHDTRFLKAFKDRKRWLLDLCEKFNAEYVSCSYGDPRMKLLGFVFSTPPDDWKPVRSLKDNGNRVYLPKKKSPDYETLKSVPYDLSEELEAGKAAIRAELNGAPIASVFVIGPAAFATVRRDSGWVRSSNFLEEVPPWLLHKVIWESQYDHLRDEPIGQIDIATVLADNPGSKHLPIQQVRHRHILHGDLIIPATDKGAYPSLVFTCTKQRPWYAVPSWATHLIIPGGPPDEEESNVDAGADSADVSGSSDQPDRHHGDAEAGDH